MFGRRRVCRRCRPEDPHKWVWVFIDIVANLVDVVVGKITL